MKAALVAIGLLLLGGCFVLLMVGYYLFAAVLAAFSILAVFPHMPDDRRE